MSQAVTGAPATRSPIGLPERFRALTLALDREVGGRPVVYLDGPGGSQMLAPALAAMDGYVRRGMANRHGAFATSVETEELLDRARTLLRALLGAPEHEIVFGQNMTALAFETAVTLAREWTGGGPAVLLSELDHHANVDPWGSVAAERGIERRWLTVCPETLRLDLSSLDRGLDGGARLAAVGLASNAIGTVQDVTAIAAAVHAAGGLVAVDAVHAVPHLPVDAAGLGADILYCSGYKFFGPHVGVMAIRREVLDRARFYKVRPAPDAGSGKAELGSQNHEAIAGLAAGLETLAGLADGADRDPAAAFRATFQAIEGYERPLAERLAAGLADLPGARVWRASGPGPQPAPTVAFTVAGAAPAAVAAACGRGGVFVTNGDFYATTLASRLGLGSAGGWVRAGIAPYTTDDEVDRALRVVREAVERHGGPPFAERSER